MKTRILIALFSLVLISCKTEEKQLTAQEIIDKSIQNANIDKVSNATLSFDFRERTYIADRNSGVFTLKRITKKGTETITDILSNDGFQRLLNGEKIHVADSMAFRYSESINSVHYFSVLPYGLNDAAVNKKLLEDTTVKGKEYYKVQVTFDQNGGGVDFEDVFVYWIDKERFTIDYLAYLFHVNGGGKRFREVSKEHIVEGVRFVNYNNYKPNNSNIELSSIDKAFESNDLTKVSEVNLENIQLVENECNSC
ncbi:DUF6503 family protein [Pseudotenacibaculum sp. MALMAid0570]|uniref:DUF6503 family protein n=1 Tax=Pseudotenacibaculum sp. MALMAid0570 TaxID=3143938 RepID=UPI0032E016CB